MAVLSSDVLDDVVQRIAEQCSYVSLHHSVPSFESATATEISFGGYARQKVFWEEVGSGVMRQSNSVTFQGLTPPVLVVAIGLNTGTIGNDMTMYEVLTTDVVSSETTFQIPAGRLILNFASA